MGMMQSGDEAWTPGSTVSSVLERTASLFIACFFHYKITLVVCPQRWSVTLNSVFNNTFSVVISKAFDAVSIFVLLLFLMALKLVNYCIQLKQKELLQDFQYTSHFLFLGGGLEDYLQALCVPVGSLWLQSLSESCKNTRSNPTLISSFANVIFCRATGFSFLLTLSLQGLCGWCNDHFHSVSCNFTWPCFLHAFMWWLHDQNAK